jgi:anti-sigma factor RsiW
MSDHVAPELLASFVAGELGDHAAALVARHLDDCPTCTARVMAADSLTAALRIPDPVVPDDLVARVMEAAAPPPPSLARHELLAGAGLIAAGMVAWLLGSDLSDLGARLDVLGSALATASGQLRAQPALLASLAASATAAAAATVTLATRSPERTR